MGKSKEVELLTGFLNEVSDLKQLKHINPKYELWRDRVETTLETLYGKSREYYRFATRLRVFNPYDSEDDKQQKYLSYVSTDENSLKAVIAIVETRRVTNSILRVKSARIWNGIKDFITSIIAKFAAEKTK